MWGKQRVRFLAGCLLLFSLTAQAQPDQQQRLLQQKLMLLDNLLFRSAATRAIEQDGSDAARAMVESARAKFQQAKQQGDSAQAMTLADGALKTLSEARTTAAGALPVSAQQKARYRELREAILSIEQIASAALPDAVRVLLGEAEQEAGENNYARANIVLSQAYEQAQQVVTKELDNKTVVYSLDFASPKDEFDYEYRRYQSSQKLIHFMRQQKPQPALEQMLSKLLLEAEQLRREAELSAQRGAYQEAVPAMEQGNRQLQRALRLLGAQV